MPTDGLPELRLMQLVSPALPIGAFTYSQGLEWAVESGQVTDMDTVYDWLLGQVEDGLTYLDLPILKRMYLAVKDSNPESVNYWSEYLLACRETSELRQEEINRGRALLRLLTDLEITGIDQYQAALQLNQSAGFALACAAWDIPLSQALLGFSWGWLENQVAAAIKLVPLGQTAGQKLQLKLSDIIPDAVNRAMKVTDDEIGSSAPAFAIASSLHETQYTRLFRS